MSHNLRTVFFGTPRIAEIVLAALLDARITPVAVVTNHDRPAGRHGTLTPSPVKQLIATRGLAGTVPVLQPEKLKDAYEALRALKPDVFVVAAYGKILRAEALAIPRLGAFCVHPSLLPKYRGPAPMKAALLNGDTETGVTIIKMDEEMDHGPIAAMETASVAPRETYLTLERKLGTLGATLTAQVLEQLATNTLVLTEQNHSEATYTKKYTAEDAFLPFEDVVAGLRGNEIRANRAARMVAALTPEPGVWTVVNDVRWKLLEAYVEDARLVPVTVQKAGEMPELFRTSELARVATA